MLRITKSLLTIFAVAVLATSATGAYFSDTTTITDNSFSTGVLEIRVNGQPSVIGDTFAPTVPGDVYHSRQYEINNYGQPWFAGPSTLTAKQLILNYANANAHGSGLWDKVMIKIEVNRGWPSWQVSYNGLLKDMHDVDLLNPNWSELIPGSSESFRYQVWVEDTGVNQNGIMGKTLDWDFVIEGRTS